MTAIEHDNPNVVWRHASQWSGYLAALYPGVEVQMRPDPRSFRAYYRAWNLGGIEFAEIRTSAPQRMCVSIPGAASPDSYYIPLQLQGSFQGGQFDRECGNQERTMMLLDSRAPHWRELSADSHMINVRVPAAMLERHLLEPRRFCVNALQADKGRPALVWDFLTNLWLRRDELQGADNALADTAAQMIAEMFAALDVEQTVGRAHTLRRDLLQYISQHIADAELNVQTAAVALGISPRYVHALLRPTGRSFAEHLLELRLDQCRRALLNYASVASITQIAFNWGFNEMSHFSRAFRRRFGVSPRDYRRNHSH